MGSIVHGIEEITFQADKGDGTFPTAWIPSSSVISIKGIAIDSVNKDQEDDEEEIIDVEEIDDPYAILDGKKGKRTIVLETYDISDEMLKYFCGYKDPEGSDSANTGFLLSPAKPFAMANQSLRIKSKAGAASKSRIDDYTPVKVTAKVTGTQGKKTPLKMTIKCTLVGNKNAKGEVLPNHRTKLDK